MIQPPPTRTAAQVLVDALRIHGTDHVFCVPGESFLPVLDALHDAEAAMRLIVCRQEGGAAFMAEAYGKLTGRPGICFVTRGPGLFNASIGLHTAQQDSTPLILFMGQVARRDMEREAFQEVDVRRVFGSVAKWAAQIDHADRVPEMVARAFQVALAGRPGPVVLALPEDMLSEATEAADLEPYRLACPCPAPAEMARLGELLAASERPFVLVGGPGWSARVKEDIEAVAQANGLPVATAFRAQDYFDNDHPCYAGTLGIGPSPALVEHVRRSDLLLVIGERLGEMTTQGYQLLAPPRLDKVLVHVFPGAEELGRVYQPDLPIQAAPAGFAAALRALPPFEGAGWRDRSRQIHGDALNWQRPTAGPGALQLGEVVAWLRGRLPADAILTNGAGNFAGWIHRHYRFRRYRTQLAPIVGAMGYDVPAAVAAKLVHPDRVVVSVAGDGSFLMNGQELATAVQYGLAVIFIVVNNGMYGTIRMHQERTYPGRVSGTSLANPDFVALARAYGAQAELVERTEQFAAAFDRALGAGKPALLELRLDPEAITTATTLSAIREKALAQQSGGQ